MIERSFVQFSKQFARSEKGALSKASWSVLDDYFLFQNNYYKGKMGYIAVIYIYIYDFLQTVAHEFPTRAVRTRPSEGQTQDLWERCFCALLK